MTVASQGVELLRLGDLFSVFSIDVLLDDTISTANTWNRLPDRVKGQRTVNGFKNAYDAWKRGEPITLNEQAVGNDDESETNET